MSLLRDRIDAFVTSMRDNEIPDVSFQDCGPSEYYRHVSLSPSQWNITIGSLRKSPFRTITVCGVYTFYLEDSELSWSEQPKDRRI
jgi:hypothetical protein